MHNLGGESHYKRDDVQKIITLQSLQRKQSSINTHCPYCAFQCGMSVSGSHSEAQIVGNEQFPVNKGRLCAKGWNAASTLAHPGRLLTPLIRNEQGTLEPALWESALSLIAQSFKRVQERYGKDAVGLFGGGSLTNEKAYLLGKFARVALGTSQIDYNGRLRRRRRRLVLIVVCLFLWKISPSLMSFF